MAIATDLKWKDHHGKDKIGYYIDQYIVDVGDAIAKRVTQRDQDCAVIFDGREGSGKTNASVVLAHYVSHITGRPFGVEQVFFDLKEMIKYAGSTKEQIILWDEAALGGLAADWTHQSQKRLTAMLMVCRKKKHVFIFNIPRFYRLNRNIIERMHLLIHIFENNQEEPGNFIIIGQQGLENLYDEWRKTGRANYFRHKKASPGSFSYRIRDILDYDAYDKAKDAAILKLAEVGEEVDSKTLKYYKQVMVNAKLFQSMGLNKKETAEKIGIGVKTLRNIEKWAEKGQQVYITGEKKSNLDSEEQEDPNNMGDDEDDS